MVEQIAPAPDNNSAHTLRVLRCFPNYPLCVALRVMSPAMMKKPPAPSAKLHRALATPCSICFASGWVCELHPHKPMEHDNCGGAGVPCRCNPEALAEWDEKWVTGRR